MLSGVHNCYCEASIPHSEALAGSPAPPQPQSSKTGLHLGPFFSNTKSLPVDFLVELEEKNPVSLPLIFVSEYDFFAFTFFTITFPRACLFSSLPFTGRLLTQCSVSSQFSKVGHMSVLL